MTGINEWLEKEHKDHPPSARCWDKDCEYREEISGFWDEDLSAEDVYNGTCTND